MLYQLASAIQFKLIWQQRPRQCKNSEGSILTQQSISQFGEVSISRKQLGQIMPQDLLVCSPDTQVLLRAEMLPQTSQDMVQQQQEHTTDDNASSKFILANEMNLSRMLILLLERIHWISHSILAKKKFFCSHISVSKSLKSSQEMKVRILRNIKEKNTIRSSLRSY